MNSPRPKRTLSAVTDTSRFVYLDRSMHGSADLWVGSQRVLRLAPRRSRVTRQLVQPLYAHRNGLSVLRAEFDGMSRAARAYRKSRLLCGVLVSTRWGTALVQWRGFPRG